MLTFHQLMSKALFICLLLILAQLACTKPRPASEFISLNAPIIALTHVRVIDGTGAPAREDQTIIIESGQIKAIGSNIPIPAGAKSLDLDGHTAIPGLVGMHEHLFYSTAGGDHDVLTHNTFPALYLAAGVTTIRTAGTLNLDNDLTTKQLIDRGQAAGPKIHISSPYINHPSGQSLTNEKITQLINEWADQGVTSFKVYTNISKAELAAVITAAHNRGLKVTGHLCAVGFREAAALGIDNLEHGLLVDTEFYAARTPNQCPKQSDWLPELARMDMHSKPVRELIRDLVSHRVAITSTLPIYETFIGEQFQIDPRMQEVLTPDAYAACLSKIAQDKPNTEWRRVWQAAFRKEMEFEREFVKAGGLLLAGIDPTGWGGVVAGFGDQRGVELLVAAGFTPEEAIHINTANAADFLGESSHIGTLSRGKQADIVILRGNPSIKISDIRDVTHVFKDGIAYDPQKLIASTHGLVGK